MNNKKEIDCTGGHLDPPDFDRVVIVAVAGQSGGSPG